MRRSRSNDGIRSSLVRGMPIDIGLFNKLLAQFVEARPQREPRIFHGPKAARGAPPSHITDEQVLAIRRMYEWCGMKPSKIAHATGLSREYVNSTVEYKNRVHLDPGPMPADQTKAAQAWKA